MHSLVYVEVSRHESSEHHKGVSENLLKYTTVIGPCNYSYGVELKDIFQSNDNILSDHKSDKLKAKPEMNNMKMGRDVKPNCNN